MPCAEATALINRAQGDNAPIAVTPTFLNPDPATLTKTSDASGATVLLYGGDSAEFQNQGASYLNAFDAQAILVRVTSLTRVIGPHPVDTPRT